MDISTNQAAEILRVTSATINLWIDQGLFPHAYKLNPSARNSPYRIPMEDVDTFREKQAQAIGTMDLARS